MSLGDVLAIVTTVIVAFGGAGAIIVVVSAWLGKLWADKLMNADRAKHESALAKLRSELDQFNQIEIEKVRTELGLSKEHRLREISDKIHIYRLMVDLISEVLAHFDRAPAELKAFEPEKFSSFNAQRLRLYGYMSLTSPQEVMDAQDQLVDYLLKVAYGSERYEWPTVRGRAIALINECRKDIGFDSTPISYNGKI